MGAPILNGYYTVFDMSPLESNPSKEYIQIGIAKRNTNDTIGQHYFEEFRADSYQTLLNLKIILWVVIGGSLIVILSMYLFYLCKKSSQLTREK